MTTSTSHASDRLRIAFCITELEVGGAERCLVEVATGLDPVRFECQVYSLAPRPQAGNDALVARLEAAGVPFVACGGRSKLSTPWVWNRLAGELRSFRPHVLQNFLWHANVLGTLAGRRAGAPQIVNGIRVAERRSNGRLAVERWLDRWVARHVAVSESVAEFARTEVRLPAEKLVVIPNGVDLARFANASAATHENDHALLYVGRLDPQKRVDWLLRLLPTFFAEAPNWRLRIAGAGPELALLQELVRDLNLGDRVEFLGFRNDVPALLAASDVLVLPSAWEGMPNVLLEAMAAGRPVMATDVEGVREILGSHADLQTAPRDRADRFASRLATLAGDDRMRQQIGEANRRRAAAFSLAAMVDRYARLYTELAAKS